MLASHAHQLMLMNCITKSDWTDYVYTALASGPRRSLPTPATERGTLTMSPSPIPNRITIDFRDAVRPSRSWILGVDDDTPPGARRVDRVRRPPRMERRATPFAAPGSSRSAPAGLGHVDDPPRSWPNAPAPTSASATTRTSRRPSFPPGAV